MNKTFIKIFAVMVIFVIIWAVFFKSPYFQINTIQINGLDNLTEEQVKSMLTTNEGNNIFSFSASKCEKRLSKSHYVESVSVSRDLPHTIVIDLNEYKLRGYVPYMGSYLYINENGLILDIQKNITKQLPVILGLNFDSFTAGEILRVDNPSAFSTMVELSRLFDKYQLLTDIIKVDVTNVNDIHLYVNKVDVEFGDMDNANRKILMLIEVLKQLDTNYAGILNLTGDNATFEYLT